MNLFKELEGRGHQPLLIGTDEHAVQIWSTVCDWGALTAMEDSDGGGSVTMQVFRPGWAWAGRLRVRSMAARVAAVLTGIAVAVLVDSPLGVTSGMVAAVLPELVGLLAIQSEIRLPLRTDTDGAAARLLSYVLDWDRPDTESCDGDCGAVRQAVIMELWGSHVPWYSPLMIHDYRRTVSP